MKSTTKCMNNQSYFKRRYLSGQASLSLDKEPLFTEYSPSGQISNTCKTMIMNDYSVFCPSIQVYYNTRLSQTVKKNVFRNPIPSYQLFYKSILDSKMELIRTTFQMYA